MHQKEFESMREGFYLNFQPKEALEVILLERVISCAWRLVLVTQAEAEIFDSESSYDRVKDIFEGYSADNMITLTRYENAIERSFYKALEALKQTQLSNKESTVEIGFVS